MVLAFDFPGFVFAFPGSAVAFVPVPFFAVSMLFEGFAGHLHLQDQALKQIYTLRYIRAVSYYSGKQPLCCKKHCSFQWVNLTGRLIDHMLQLPHPFFLIYMLHFQGQ